MNTAAMSTGSMSAGWSAFIIALVVLNVVGCVWLIWWTAKVRPGDPGPTDTSHVWDENITEYNKPLPKWWNNLFYITIVFTVGYLAWFPGPGAFAGYSGWSSVSYTHLDVYKRQIFAFGGSALFATSLYVVQRTSHVRLLSDKLAAFVFWGWQLVIVLAAITLPLGLTEGKEYAELIWPIDVLIAVVWVAYAVLFFGTIGKRKVKHIYVANWFYGAFIIAVALLHIVNSLAIPVDLTHSFPIYSGAVDAMVQWWYGHNAVGFFLTAGFLGMMYYFIPKQTGRPVYSCLLYTSRCV